MEKLAVNAQVGKHLVEMEAPDKNGKS